MKINVKSITMKEGTLGTIGTAISITTTVLGLIGSMVDKKQQNELIKEEVTKQVARRINKNR